MERREDPGFEAQGSTRPVFPRQRVLLFVALDVDSLCACKILQVSTEDPGRMGPARGEVAG